MRKLFDKLFKDIDFQDVKANVDKFAFISFVLWSRVEQINLNVNDITNDLKKGLLKLFKEFEKPEKNIKEKKEKVNLNDFIYDFKNNGGIG